MSKFLLWLQERLKYWTKPVLVSRTVQKPHPKNFTLEKRRRVQKPRPKYLATKANGFLYQLEYDYSENSGVINGVVHSGKYFQDLSDIVSSWFSFGPGKGS